MSESLLLSLKSAAALLDTTENALRCRLKRGWLPVVRVGRSVYLRRRDLLRAIEEGTSPCLPGVLASGCGLSPLEVASDGK